MSDARSETKRNRRAKANAQRRLWTGWKHKAARARKRGEAEPRKPRWRD